MGDSSIQKNLNTVLGVVANGIGITGLSSNTNQDRDIKENSNNIETNKNINQKNKYTINKAIDDINNTQIPEILDEISRDIERKKKSINSHIQKTVEGDFKDLHDKIDLREKQITERTVESLDLEKEIQKKIDDLDPKRKELDTNFTINLDLEKSILMKKEIELNTKITKEKNRATQHESEIMAGDGNLVYHNNIGNVVEIFEIGTEKTEKKSGWLWKKSESKLYVVSTCSDYIIRSYDLNGIIFENDRTRLDALLGVENKFYIVAFNPKISSYQQFNIKLVSCCFRNNIGLFEFEKKDDMVKLSSLGFSLDTQISLEKGDDCFMLGSYFDNLDNFSISKGIVRNNVYNQTGNESILVDIISDFDASTGSPIVDKDGNIIAMKQAHTIENNLFDKQWSSIIKSGSDWSFDYIDSRTDIKTRWYMSYFTNVVDEPNSLGYWTFFDPEFNGVDPPVDDDGNPIAGNYFNINIIGEQQQLFDKNNPRKALEYYIEITPALWQFIKDDWTLMGFSNNVNSIDLSGTYQIKAWKEGLYGNNVLIDVTEKLVDGTTITDYPFSNRSFYDLWMYTIITAGLAVYQPASGIWNSYMSKSGTIGISKRIMEPVLYDLVDIAAAAPNGDTIDQYLRKSLLLSENFSYFPYYFESNLFNWEELEDIRENDEYYGGKKEITIKVNEEDETFSPFGYIRLESQETIDYTDNLSSNHPGFNYNDDFKLLGIIYKPTKDDPNYVEQDDGEQNDEEDQQHEVLIKFGNHNDDQRTISSVTQFMVESNYKDAKLVFLVFKKEPDGTVIYDNTNVIVDVLPNIFGEWSDTKLNSFTTEYFLDNNEVPYFRKENKKNYIKLLKQNKKIKQNKKMQYSKKISKMLKLKKKNKV